MKYLVDVSFSVDLHDVPITVDDFDEDAMASQAVRQWLEAIRYTKEVGSISCVLDEELTNHNRIS